MKSVVLVLVLVLAAVLSALPVAASCLTSSPLSSANGTDPANRSFIWTAAVFDPFYFTSYAPLDYQPPFTSQLGASFWIAGEGIPDTTGMGADSGTRDLVATGDLAFLMDPFPVYFGAELNTNWDLLNGCDLVFCHDSSFWR